MYADVRELLEPGFLSCAVDVGTTRLVMRSLDKADTHVSAHMVRPDSDWRVWPITMSLWVVDGLEISRNDSEARRYLSRLVSHLPGSAKEKLCSVLIGFHSRMQKAISAVSAFVLEEDSRRLWKSVRDKSGGIRNRYRFGENGSSVQTAWAAWNEMEDSDEEEERQWMHVKMTIAPHAPKYVKKVSSADAQRLGKERSRRSALLDAIYFAWMGIEGVASSLSDDRIAYVHRATTDEDLQAEMDRWKRGEEDAHDAVVREYKDNIRKGFEAKRAERAKAWDMASADSSEDDQGLVAYTSDQLDSLISGKPNVRFLADGNQEEVFDRFIAREPSSTELEIRDGAVVPVAPDKPDDSLDEAISRRRPTME